MILKISTIEAEIIVDALIERAQKLETILNDLKGYHMNVSSFYYEIEAHNELVKMIKES